MGQAKTVNHDRIDEQVARLTQLHESVRKDVGELRRLRKQAGNDLRRARSRAKDAEQAVRYVAKRSDAIREEVEQVAQRVIRNFVRNEVAMVQTKIDELKRRQVMVRDDIEAFHRYVKLLKSRLEYMTEVDETELANQAELRLVSAGAGAIVEIDEDDDAEDDRDVRFLESEL